ncbi:MAG: NACHT domain-containing protein [Solirubrobacteraceae bacterium]
MLLVGAPGGGKSTALRAAAARWARWADWPVPISIELRRLAMRCARTGSDLTQAILDLACESAPASDRPALRAALEHELDEGRCLLLLDGLDEIDVGRIAFVERPGQGPCGGAIVAARVGPRSGQAVRGAPARGGDADQADHRCAHRTKTGFWAARRS